MEAEAQCAYLCKQGFVDGVVTDDSDIFLFLSSMQSPFQEQVQRYAVYRNMFRMNAPLSQFMLKDICILLEMDAEQLIFLTLLLGSDYTVGIPGLGIKKAVKVVRIFKTAEAFKAWMTSKDAPAVKSTYPEPEISAEDARWCTQLRRAIKLPTTAFPDIRVQAAYQHPMVTQTRKENLVWRPIQVDALVR